MAVKNVDLNVEYPYVFLVSQSLAQRRHNLASEAPEYTLSLTWKYYKVADTGEVVFDDSRQVTIDIDNFFELAMQDYANGYDSHLATIMMQQESVRRIVSEYTGERYEVEV